MAEAAKKNVPVTKTEPRIVLTLTEDEANTLFVLTGSVTGDSMKSPRKHTNAVYGALSTVTSKGSYEFEEYDLLSGGSIMFDNYRKSKG